MALAASTEEKVAKQYIFLNIISSATQCYSYELTSGMDVLEWAITWDWAPGRGVLEYEHFIFMVYCVSSKCSKSVIFCVLSK